MKYRNRERERCTCSRGCFSSSFFFLLRFHPQRLEQLRSQCETSSSWRLEVFSITPPLLSTLTPFLDNNKVLPNRKRFLQFYKFVKRVELQWSGGEGRRLVFKRSWVQIPVLDSGWTLLHINL